MNVEDKQPVRSNLKYANGFRFKPANVSFQSPPDIQVIDRHESISPRQPPPTDKQPQPFWEIGISKVHKALWLYVFFRFTKRIACWNFLYVCFYAFFALGAFTNRICLSTDLTFILCTAESIFCTIGFVISCVIFCAEPILYPHCKFSCVVLILLILKLISSVFLLILCVYLPVEYSNGGCPYMGYFLVFMYLSFIVNSIFTVALFHYYRALGGKPDSVAPLRSPAPVAVVRPVVRPVVKVQPNIPAIVITEA